MSIPNINPSPDALLAGIEAVARAIGRNCQMDMMIAMARAEAKAAPPVASDTAVRDQLAAAALPAIIAATFAGAMRAKDQAPTTEEVMAKQAYHFADAMLAARSAA